MAQRIERLYNSGVDGVIGVPFKAAMGDNGRLLAVGYTGGQVVLWDVDHAQNPVLSLRNAVTTSPPTLGLAISDNGRLLATAYAEDRVAIWDITERRAVANFRADDATTILKFSADGGRLLAAGFAMAVFNIATNHLTRSPLPVPESGLGEPADASFGADGVSIVAAGGYIVLWTPGKGTPRLVETGLDSIAVSPDGTRIAAVSGGGEVSVWDVRTRQETDSWRAINNPVAVTFLGNSQRLALGSSTRNVRHPIRSVEISDLPGGKLVTQYHGAGEGLVDRIIYDPRGLIIALSQGAHEYPQHEIDAFVAPS